MTHVLNDNKSLGGLDFDSDPRAVAPGDYINARNIRNAINSSGKGKTLTNVLSTVAINKYILPYTGGSFPAGINRCIGTKEDTKYNTVLAFIWNSNKKHQILRFYRNNTDANNPYGEVQQVMSYDFGWTKKTRITGVNIVYGNPQGDAAGETNNIGDLLYWNDPVPRKINLTKGNICTKLKSWKVLLPLGYANTQFSFQIVVRNFATNGPVASIQVNVAPNLGIDGIFSSIATQINAGLGTYLAAEACDCKLEISEKAVNAYNIVFTNTDFIVVPQNWYGTTLIDRFFDHCKWPALNPPLPEYKQDANYFPNYVKRKVFQFRLRFNYDDLEPSVLGVWSQIPVNNLACDGNSDDALNYINIDFNEPLLLNPVNLVLLRSVDVIVREGNTGANKQVISLEPCEFLDITAGNALYAHWKFYNNIASVPIDTTTAAQLYDDVPLEVNDELTVKNRMVMAGIKTGYDAPECPVASYEIDFAPPTTKPLRKIKGRIRVISVALSDSEQNSNNPPPPTQQRNYYNTFPNFPKIPFFESTSLGDRYAIRRGGIFHDISRTTNDFAFFGGGGFGTGAGGDFGIRAGMEDIFDQRIPEAGWPVYAAGKPYFAVSKQINVGLAADAAGALDTSTTDKKDAIGSYLYCGSGGQCSDLYSEFEMLVPDDDTYVIRLASHWCSFDDKLGKGFAYNLSAGTSYQKTSTNVWAVVDANGNQLNQKEFTVAVSGADVFIGDFLVMDLAPPFDADFTAPFGENGIRYMGWQPINGYLVDSSGATDINSANFTGVPVEKTLVSFSKSLSGFGDFYNGTIRSVAIVSGFEAQFYDINVGWGEAAFTDHNGYFFGIAGATPSAPGEAVSNDDLSKGKNYNFLPISAYQSKLGGTNDVYVIRSVDTLLYTGSVSDYYNKTLVGTNFDGSDQSSYGLVHFFCATTKTDARQEGSTNIQGTVIDQNNAPVGGIFAVYQNGQSTTSNNAGFFRIFAWSDMVTPNLGVINTSSFIPRSDRNRTVDYVVISGIVFCGITYPNGQLYSVLITPFGSAPNEYNPGNPYVLAVISVIEINNPAQKARKRGGQYIDVIRYYDNQGRMCSCTKLYDLYVPFETEDLNKYLPAQYPPNTYIQGKPTIRWALGANYQPPQWAAYYQFMRSKNLSSGRYLQWCINEATYLSQLEISDNSGTVIIPEITTSFNNGNATAVKLSLRNIVDFAAINPDSQIGYNFEEGDRIRLIASRGLIYYTGINDLEVLSYDPTTQDLIAKYEDFSQEIESGTLIEIFKAKSVADDEIQEFWEVGEVYPCTNPGNVNNAHSVTSGTFTNGDTYWRGRIINVNDDNDNFAAAFPVTIEDASVSDFYPSLAEDIGRVGVIDPAFTQLYEPDTMIASADFMPGTAVNGLSTFNPNIQPEVVLDRSYGDIMRILFEQNNLVAVTRIKEISNYIQRQTLYNAGGNTGVVSLSGEFFGTDYVHAQNLGTDLPATILSNNGNIFGWNSLLANVWKYQGDGEKVISDEKAVSWFKQLQEDGVTDAIAVYDRYHEEYILTYWRRRKQVVLVSTTTKLGGGYNILLAVPVDLPQLNSDVEIQIPDGKTYAGTVTVVSAPFVLVYVETTDTIRLGSLNPVTLVYSLPETICWFEGNPTDQRQGAGQRWRTFYDFEPEFYSGIGAEVVSFVNGRVHIHDKGRTPRNNFYGTQYKSLITPVFQQEPDINKAWNALWMNSRQDNGGCNWHSDNINGRGIYNLDGQLSRIKAANFRKDGLGGWWTTDFKRDLTDSVATNPILNGRVMRGEVIICEMINDHTGEVTLWDWKANWTPSERTTK